MENWKVQDSGGRNKLTRLCCAVLEKETNAGNNLTTVNLSASQHNSPSEIASKKSTERTDHWINSMGVN